MKPELLWISEAVKQLQKAMAPHEQFVSKQAIRKKKILSLTFMRWVSHITMMWNSSNQINMISQVYLHSSKNFL